MITVKNEFGITIDFNSAAALMDDYLRESVAYDLAPCSEQEFFDAYCKAHLDQYGEPFECAKENPVY